ncbi:hypothetical protein MJM99_30440, partial [Salmonella enterica subsp. enterica serovar Kentucky]|nr:hypothetical protein [Salmonella enterica subsp. enterica serovar Kentucky]
DPIGRIYLNFAELEFTDFSSLMAEIRRISGVTDVRTVPWMPSLGVRPRSDYIMSKTELYAALNRDFQSLMAGETSFLATLANTS